MAKAPTPGRYTPPGAKDKSTAPQLFVGFDGEEWGFRYLEITPQDAADLDKRAGMGPRALMSTFAEHPNEVDLHTAAGLIFLARRQTEGRWVTWAQATDGLSYDSAITIRNADDVTTAESESETEDDSPEA